MLFGVSHKYACFIFLYLHLFSVAEHVSHGKALLKNNHYYYFMIVSVTIFIFKVTGVRESQNFWLQLSHKVFNRFGWNLVYC